VAASPFFGARHGPRLITNIVDTHDQLVRNAEVQLQMKWEGAMALARFTLASSRSDTAK
jgi:hypothetical protein